MNADWVVLDVEGTLTATSQTEHVLGGYARPRLGPLIEGHGDEPVVAEAVAQARKLGDLPATATTAEVVTVLHGWMDEGREVEPLTTLQGLVREKGYRDGDLVTELFVDVVPKLRVWHAAGTGLAVFSSGSVAGQAASFTRTTDGDLTPLFRAYFDTVSAGPKREIASYLAIARDLGADPARVVLFSDTPAELDAAEDAGWQTVSVARQGEPFADADFGTHRTVASFIEVSE
ncbi:acireductone synthase [Actinophytocola oryzae]|uniref:Acireductone synthase n=1 Tax=Actinophytocola oryzae TaxID=502181 RepID=A0A4R7VYD5_9PSEU|nr:acireductone synthase [Actinophytocola oryzae]TDV55186.1 acireductone synthase [Actinophytocola oryzae]